MKEQKCIHSIPISEKYMLSIREASEYFSIGIKSMRRLAENNLGKCAVFINSKYYIVRPLFEEYILKFAENDSLEITQVEETTTE